MDNHHEHHSNGFMNGFLLGAIIGAAVVFFLFTEKGKKLLKTITEEGMEGFADLQDIIGEEMDEDEYEDAEYHASTNSKDEHVIRPAQVQRPPSGKVKRFFRGIKR